MKRIDLTGHKFGRLTVAKFSTYRKKIAWWLCKCECGKEVVIASGKLREGRTQSCGCLQQELRMKWRPDNQGKAHPNWKGGKYNDGAGYTLVHMPSHPHSNKQGYVLEHRLVAERALGTYIQPNHVIHHINGIRDDNRLENLWWFPTAAKHTAYHAELKRRVI